MAPPRMVSGPLPRAVARIEVDLCAVQRCAAGEVVGRAGQFDGARPRDIEAAAAGDGRIVDEGSPAPAQAVGVVGAVEVGQERPVEGPLAAGRPQAHVREGAHVDGFRVVGRQGQGAGRIGGGNCKRLRGRVVGAQEYGSAFFDRERTGRGHGVRRPETQVARVNGGAARVRVGSAKEERPGPGRCQSPGAGDGAREHDRVAVGVEGGDAAGAAGGDVELGGKGVAGLQGAAGEIEGRGARPAADFGNDEHPALEVVGAAAAVLVGEPEDAAGGGDRVDSARLGEGSVARVPHVLGRRRGSRRFGYTFRPQSSSNRG